MARRFLAPCSTDASISALEAYAAGSKSRGVLSSARGAHLSTECIQRATGMREQHHATVDLLEQAIVRGRQKVLRRRTELLGGLAPIGVLQRHARFGHVRLRTPGERQGERKGEGEGKGEMDEDERRPI